MTRSEALPASAVEKGSSAEILYHLGMMYCLGREVERNYVTAHKWFNIAALKGSPEARRCRCEISREMSTAQIAEAQRLARDWISLH
jgi:TPR repeat protein